jgi:hypothetical protein
MLPVTGRRYIQLFNLKAKREKKAIPETLVRRARRARKEIRATLVTVGCPAILEPKATRGIREIRAIPEKKAMA